MEIADYRHYLSHTLFCVDVSDELMSVNLPQNLPIRGDV